MAAGTPCRIPSSWASPSSADLLKQRMWAIWWPRCMASSPVPLAKVMQDVISTIMPARTHCF